MFNLCDTSNQSLALLNLHISTPWPHISSLRPSVQSSLHLLLNHLLRRRLRTTISLNLQRRGLRTLPFFLNSFFEVGLGATAHKSLLLDFILFGFEQAADLVQRTPGPEAAVRRTGALVAALASGFGVLGDAVFLTGHDEVLGAAAALVHSGDVDEGVVAATQHVEGVLHPADLRNAINAYDEKVFLFLVCRSCKC